MRDSRARTTAHPLFLLAATAYVANCALGTAVAVGAIDTSRFRWVHHALYVATCATTACAIAFGCRGRDDRTAALALAPAVVPLAVIPYAGTRGRRHPLVALAAAPFILAGVALTRRPSDRK